MKKYSKSSNFYRNIKSSFYNRNESLLKAELDRNRVYLKQPPRDKCKLCGSKLPETIDFTKHLVSYCKCTNLCNSIELFLKNDYPLIIKYAVASLGEIKLCLAPLPSECN